MINKPVEVSRWLFVLALAAVTTSSALASGITGPACGPGTFTSYERLEGGCNSGPIQLLGFSLLINGQIAPSSFTDTISVDSVFRGGALILSLGGFEKYPVAATDSTSYQIDFSADPPPILAGESVELDPPFGRIVGSQFFCGDAFTITSSLSAAATACSQQGTLSFDESHPASVTFSPPLVSLDLQTFFTLNPNRTTASGIDGVVFTILTVPVASPEPGTWILMAGGLTLAAYRRRLFRG